MDTLRRYQIRTAIVGLALTVAAAAIAWALDPLVGQGIVLGGIAGTAGFWMLASRVAGITRMPRERIAFEMYTGVVLRLLVYGAALVIAYQLDPEGMHALLAALCSMLGLRTALVFMGFVGVARRLRRERAR